MAGELFHRYSATGAALYGTIRNAARQYWNTAGTPNFETLTVANWADYDVALTETPASSYFYVGTFPAISGNMVAGWYWVDVYLRAGGSPAISDTLITTLRGYWDGTTFKQWAADATHVGGTLQTAGDLYAAVAAFAGSGARAVTITVNDGATILEGVKVRVTKGAESYVVATNASGQAVFNLDDGTWTVALSLAGYSYAGTTLVVDGTETETYSMTALALTASTDPNASTGYLTCYDEDGEAQSGVVIYCQQTAALSGSAYACSGAVRSETSDATGLVQFTNLWQGAQYAVWRGTGTPVKVVVPDATTFALPSILGQA